MTMRTFDEPGGEGLGEHPGTRERGETLAVQQRQEPPEEPSQVGETPHRVPEPHRPRRARSLSDRRRDADIEGRRRLERGIVGARVHSCTSHDVRRRR